MPAMLRYAQVAAGHYVVLSHQQRPLQQHLMQLVCLPLQIHLVMERATALWLWCVFL